MILRAIWSSRLVPNVANGGNHRINKLDRLQAERREGGSEDLERQSARRCALQARR
jgi:hypothetical protein